MELPEENIGSATGRVREDSTHEGGDLGSLEELNKILKKNSKINFK